MKFLRKFWAFLKAYLQGATTYPGMLVVWMFDLFFGPLVMLFVWSTIASEAAQVNDQLPSLINYYILLPLVSLFTSAWQGVFIARDIRLGDINSRLTKPIFPIIHSITNNLAEKIIKLFFLGPMVVVTMSIFPFSIQPSLAALTLLPVILIFGAVIHFLSEELLGYLGFWLDDVSAFNNLLDISRYTLGGIIIPIFLFPPNLKIVATLLPFRYFVAFPLEVISGALNHGEIALGVVIQLVWISLISFANYLLWKKGIQKHSAVGG